MAMGKVFAIRMCKSNEPKGFKFSKPKGEQKGVVTIANKTCWSLCVRLREKAGFRESGTACAGSGLLTQRPCALT